MEVFRTLDDVTPAPEGRALALGTFDGVHRGHREVIARAREWARANDARASVVTFDPHPMRVVRPEEPPRLLTTTELKLDLIGGLGVDEAIVVPFTKELSLLEPEAFSRAVLAERLGARHVAVGANFRFGHAAAGDAATLREGGMFEVEVVPLIEHAGGIVSSSRIRELIATGDVAAAADLLAGPFTLEGRVVEGASRGRELEMPTANLEPPAELVVPGAGVYAARALLPDAEELAAAVNVGVRPTFEEQGETKVEAHLLGFQGDLYGRTLRLAFLSRLRDEERFETAEELVDQMQQDVEEVRRVVAERS